MVCDHLGTSLVGVLQRFFGRKLRSLRMTSSLEQFPRRVGFDKSQVRHWKRRALPNVKRYLTILGLGFFVWGVTFVIAIAMTPVKTFSGKLFDSLIPVVLAIVVLVFSAVYFKNVRGGFLREGIVLGFVWLAASLLLDFPMFSEGPMKMSFGDYMMDIGFDYLLIPATTIGLGYVLEMKLRAVAPAR